MSKSSNRIAFATLAGLLALAPAFAQSQGTTSGSNTTGSSGSGSQSGSGSTGSATGSATGSGSGSQSGSGTSGSTGSTSGSRSRTSGSESSSSRLSAGDTKFVRDAGESGMAEVQLGQLGVQKATNADVKTFAQRMIDDHTQANTQLQQLASQKGVTLPTDLSMLHKHASTQLSKLSGAEFDRAFMDQMVMDHQKVVAEFDRVSKGGRDSDVKGFASTNLPTMQDHLRMAQDLDSRVGGKKGSSSSRGTKSGSSH
jgi:putative membrane protein